MIEVRRSSILLWTANLAPAFAYAACLQIRYAIVNWACNSGQHWVLVATSVVMLAIALGGGFLARAVPAENQRVEFMKNTGMMLSAFFSLTIIAFIVPDPSSEPMRLTTLLLAISFTVYTAGVVRLWRNAGRDKGIRTWEAAAFLAGSASLLIALVSPIDRLADILFSAHMTQHEILMIIAAPLLVVGRPLIAFLWALPPSWRGPVSRWTQRDAVSRDKFVHGIQHAMFFFTAALFWWTLVHGRYGRMGYGLAVFYVFLTTMHSGALGALLTFSPRPWYPAYEHQHGVNALEDQQLAGLIMWLPACVIMTVLALALFSAWLAEAEKRVAYTRSEILRRQP